jgi:hypothetical protein
MADGRREEDEGRERRCTRKPGSTTCLGVSYCGGWSERGNGAPMPGTASFHFIGLGAHPGDTPPSCSP